MNFPLCLWIERFFVRTTSFIRQKNLKGGKKMAKVELKAPVVAEIAEAVKDAQSVVLV